MAVLDTSTIINGIQFFTPTFTFLPPSASPSLQSEIELDVINGTYTRNDGIEAGSIDLTVAVISDINVVPLAADIAFGDNTNKIILRDCRLAGSVVSQTSSAINAQVRYRDRRWRWKQSGTITETFNRRDSEGTLIDNIGIRAANANEIVNRLLNEMGETNFDVSEVSGDLFPQFEWYEERLDKALLDITDRLSLRICLFNDNKIKIKKALASGLIPQELLGTEKTKTFAQDILDKPDRIRVAGRRERIQVDIQLVAVGEDSDGTIKELSDLTYAQGITVGKSTKEQLESAAKLEADLDIKETLRKAAAAWARSGFLYYQLPDPVVITYRRVGTDGLVPGDDTETLEIPRDEAAFRWLPEINEFQTGDDGVAKRLAPFVKGIHLTLDRESEFGAINPTDEEDRVKINFSIDHNLGILKFSKPVWVLDGNNAMIGADLLLVGAFEGVATIFERVLDFTNESDRIAVTRQVRVIYRDDLVWEYLDDPGTSETVITPSPTITANRAKAKAYIDEIEEEYVTDDDARTRAYPGILDSVQPDGKIDQVTWRFDSAGSGTPDTTVSWGKTHDLTQETRRVRLAFIQTAFDTRATKDAIRTDTPDERAPDDRID